MRLLGNIDAEDKVLGRNTLDFDYMFLDHYWTDEGHFPFFIMQIGKLAGFVLVREISDSAKTEIFNCGVFYIKKVPTAWNR